jgi:hypothetical protein
MKQIRIDKNDKLRILSLHNKNILAEQTTENKSIADIQKLLGLKDDNQFGPQTLAAIKTKLGQPDKVTTTPTITTSSTETTKTDLPSDFGQIKPIEMSQMKVGALTTDGGKVTGVATSTVQGKPEENASDAIDSKNP